MAFNILDVQDDYLPIDQDEVFTPDQVAPITLKEIVRETNSFDNGFEAEVYVDDVFPENVSFNIAHVYNGVASTEDEAVGLLLTVDSARALARLLNRVADRIAITQADFYND